MPQNDKHQTLSVPPGVPTAQRIYSQSIDDASMYGVVVEVDPDDAERMGAFVEDAISAEDAEQSMIDGEVA